MRLVEVRCKGCGELLGKFEGKGEIKCPKGSCRGKNVFDSETGSIKFVPKSKGTPYKDRKTASGVTFR